MKLILMIAVLSLSGCASKKFIAADCFPTGYIVEDTDGEKELSLCSRY